jgi:hypothetical protein
MRWMSIAAVLLATFGTTFGAAFAAAEQLRDPCDVVSPPGAIDENEPPLVDEYVDHWNGGCAAPADHQFQELGSASGTVQLFGRSGWFSPYGWPNYDSDWFAVEVGDDTGLLTATIESEFPVWLELIEVTGDCDSWGAWRVLESATCVPETLGIWAAGLSFALVVTPTMSVPPEGDGVVSFDYLLTVEGLAPVATEETSWGAVKSLFR